MAVGAYSRREEPGEGGSVSSALMRRNEDRHLVLEGCMSSF